MRGSSRSAKEFAVRAPSVAVAKTEPQLAQCSQ
jgi:hypothetical protein